MARQFLIARCDLSLKHADYTDKYKIDRLEHSGQVKRRSDPNDRRNTLIHLSTRGCQIESEMTSTARKLGEQTFKHLDGDERAAGESASGSEGKSPENRECRTGNHSQIRRH